MACGDIKCDGEYFKAKQERDRLKLTATAATLNKKTKQTNKLYFDPHSYRSYLYLIN